jgi:ferredoxin-NADP reductase
MDTKYLKITSIGHITHDVLQIITSKPEGIEFKPGQAADISINQDGWREEIRPFTFTSLPRDHFLQFTIKTYPERKSVTNHLLSLKTSDELILHGVFGEISYKGEGYFIAGGAGITPFIAILRYLRSRSELGNNVLIFANKSKSDIILRQELEELLGKKFINILSGEKADGYSFGYISEAFLKANIRDFSKYFYLCGPPPMMDVMERILPTLGIPENRIIKEAE